MNKKALLFLLIFISVQTFAGKLEKGFEALFQFDYFKAKEYFEKSLEKQPAGAAFGLSKVYDAEKSPFYNVDTAFMYISACDKEFRKTSEKEIIILNGLDINKASIRREKVFLATFFFERAAEKNTFDALQDFIDEHPDADEFEEAEQIRNHLAYHIAVVEHTMEAYDKYVDDYPDAIDMPAAKKALQLLEYEKLTREGDAYSYQVFIKNRPENPYIDDAQEVVYEIYTADGKMESYEKFISENPENKNVNHAWQYLYNFKTSTFTAASISEFMIDYPNCPDKEKLKEDLLLSKTLFIPAKKGAMWGFVDTTGNWLITAKYQWANSYTEGKATVGFFGHTVFINKRGELIFEHMLDDASPFEHDLAVIEKEELFGVINYRGDTIVPVIYEEIGEYNQGLIYAGKEGLFGYFDVNGVEKIPFKYQTAFDFNNNKAIIKSENKYGLINILGQPLLPTVYEWILPDSNLAVAKQGDLFGLISFTGDTLLPFEYEVISSFSSHRAIAVKQGKYQYINETGKPAFNKSYNYTPSTLNYCSFTNGFARVIVNGKVGIVDTEGKMVIPAIFSDLGTYDSLLLPVNKTGKWGYATADVQLEIPYQYDYANNFKYGLAIVEKDTLAGVINTKNETVVPFEYQKIVQLDSNYFKVEQNGLFGMLNSKSEIVIPIEYSAFEIADSGVITVQKDNKVALFWLPSKEFFYTEE